MIYIVCVCRPHPSQVQSIFGYAMSVPITQKRDPSFVTDVLAGSMGGFAGKMIEFPFDTLKVRLQTAYSCECACLCIR